MSGQGEGFVSGGRVHVPGSVRWNRFALASALLPFAFLFLNSLFEALFPAAEKQSWYVYGVAGLQLVVTVLGIIFAHVAWRATRRALRGRMFAGFGFFINYLTLAVAVVVVGILLVVLAFNPQG